MISEDGPTEVGELDPVAFAELFHEDPEDVSAAIEAYVRRAYGRADINDEEDDS